MAIGLNNIENLIPNMGIKLLESEDLLKCLFYNSKDALSKPSLTQSQKYELINQNDDLINTRIFFSPAPLNIIFEDQSQLRLFIGSINPDNEHLAKLVFHFQIVVHENLWLLNNAKQRPIVMIKEIIKLLNNEDVDGIGRLKLINPISLTMFSNDFSGYMFSLQNWSD